MSALDRQWAFETALAGLRAQGRKSMAADDEGCAYRSPEGLKCAIGFLIPDDRYKPSFDKTFAPARERRIGLAVCGSKDFSPSDSEFLADMQRKLHDNLGSRLVGLNGEARRFAATWKLKYPPARKAKGQQP